MAYQGDDSNYWPTGMRDHDSWHTCGSCIGTSRETPNIPMTKEDAVQINASEESTENVQVKHWRMRRLSLGVALAILGITMLILSTLGGCGGTQKPSPIVSETDVQSDNLIEGTSVSPEPVTEEPYDPVAYQPDEISFMSLEGLSEAQIDRVMGAGNLRFRCLESLSGNLVEGRKQWLTYAKERYQAYQNSLRTGKVSMDHFMSYDGALGFAEGNDQDLARLIARRPALREEVTKFLAKHPDMIPFIQNPKPPSWEPELNFCFGEPNPK